MKLDDYLAENGIQRNHFAGKIGVCPAYVTALCNGKSWPRREVMRRIVQATDGTVGPWDFLNQDAEAASGGRESMIRTDHAPVVVRQHCRVGGRLAFSSTRYRAVTGAPCEAYAWAIASMVLVRLRRDRRRRNWSGGGPRRDGRVVVIR